MHAGPLGRVQIKSSPIPYSQFFWQYNSSIVKDARSGWYLANHTFTNHTYSGISFIYKVKDALHAFPKYIYFFKKTTLVLYTILMLLANMQACRPRGRSTFQRIQKASCRWSPPNICINKQVKYEKEYERRWQAPPPAPNFFLPWCSEQCNANRFYHLYTCTALLSTQSSFSFPPSLLILLFLTSIRRANANLQENSTQIRSAISYL